MHKKITAVLVLTLWAVLAVLNWFVPAKAISEAERRPLAQFPEVSLESVAGGKFMSEFTTYSLDQFPLRDSFRRVKSLFHYYVLGQKDNNGIYIADGFAAQLEYPLNQDALTHGLERLQWIQEHFLAGSNCKVYYAVIPDKGYYLADQNDYPAMDYEKLFSQVRTALPSATEIKLTDTLDITDYYRTDTHWRQERLFETAARICQAMGVTAPKEADYRVTALERFHHIYDMYLQDADVYLAIVPDKGYYLAENAGQLSMDYEALFAAFQQGMPWATYVDLTETLSGEDYYRTDTHWRQENLLGAAETLCEAMGAASPK